MSDYISRYIFFVHTHTAAEKWRHILKKIKRRETMASEIIVKLNQDHVKIKGCEYVRDLVRCENCRWYVPANNSDHGACGSIGGRTVYPDDFCSEGEDA